MAASTRDVDSLESLPGVGAASAEALRGRGYQRASDLIWLLPTRYDDLRRVTPFAQLSPGGVVLTEGVVSAVRRLGRPSRVRGGMGQTLEVVLEPPRDAQPGRFGLLKLVWFRARSSSASKYAAGQRLRVCGPVDVHQGALRMAHPEVASLDDPASQTRLPTGLHAVYPEVGGLSPKLVHKAVQAAVKRFAPAVVSSIPAMIAEAEGLVGLGEALMHVHCPSESLDASRLDALRSGQGAMHQRLALEELFVLQFALLLSRARARSRQGPALAMTFDDVNAVLERLPFVPTASQREAVTTIASDLQAPLPMRRLLQGDVGSGKTAVALACASLVAKRGHHQVAIVAPTEILAEQHLRSAAALALELGLRPVLLTAGRTGTERGEAIAALRSGEANLAIGTHALFSEDVAFKSLALVIIDEQHRFGVRQRLHLLESERTDAPRPHLLVMTATPIPRSLALVLHGDLDVTVMRQMPEGRIPPVTRAYAMGDRTAALRQVERALEAGGRAYIVSPLVEESESLDLRAAVHTFDELSTRFAEYGVGLVHGRLGAEARDDVMRAFANGEKRVLVSTTVIEVGVDVPEANVILIEHAERFGLSQLHQLRGRVGRGGQRSACLLVHEAKTEEAKRRIEVMCETHDGFRIAEEDLAIRGPGELLGMRQAGVMPLRFADLATHSQLLERARSLARAVIDKDQNLERPEHQRLVQMVSQAFSAGRVLGDAG